MQLGRTDKLGLKIIIIFLVLIYQLSACTIICLRGTNSIMLGKNLDWPIANGFVFFNPGLIDKQSINQGQVWQVKYSSLTVNQFGRDLPLGGINEHGLVIESTAYSPSRFSDDASGYKLNEFEWIHYHLDCCSTVNEVLVSARITAPQKWFIGLHYFIVDASGNAAYLEWIDGQLNIYTGPDLPYPVQSNNSYPNSLHYLSLHEGYGGERVEMKGPESQERFVRAVRFADNCSQVDRDAAFFGLAAVKQGDTQWSVVYDITRLAVNIIVSETDTRYSFDLHEYLGQPSVFLDFRSNSTDNGTIRLVPYSYDLDLINILSVFEQLVAAGELNRQQSTEFIQQWQALQNLNGNK